jgi:translocation and assembly module TamB
MAVSALLGPLVLVGLAWALWLWSGTSGSLGAVIKGVNWALPAGQRLQAQEVSGNLHQGGSIGQLVWEKNGLRIELNQGQVQIDWSRFWHQPWPIKSVRVGTLHLDDTSTTSTTPALSSLTLPMPVQLDWQVDRLTWHNTSQALATGLRGHYAYDRRLHTLILNEGQVAEGQYSGTAQLQAVAPMALDMRIQGLIELPNRWAQKVGALSLEASVQGPLAGEKAELTAQVQLAPSASATPTARPNSKANPEAMTLQMQARLQPWQAQPVVQALLQAQALDLALLWPGAPQTRLSGQTQLTPDGQGWHLHSEWQNSRPGPWDQQRLPASQLAIQADYQQGLWTVSRAKAQLAGGQLAGAGQQTAKGWTGHIELQALTPSQLHTALAGPPVQGQLKASDTGTGPIALSADLSVVTSTRSGSPTAPPNSSKPMQWQHVMLQGQWYQQEWDIHSLNLEAAQARLNAQFKYHPQRQTLQGQAQLNLPGLQAQVQGFGAPNQGQGHLQVDVQDAQQSMLWLLRFPFLAPAMQGLQASGRGQIKADWQGGFDQADTAIQVAMTMPRLQYNPAKALPWLLQSGQIQIQGTLKDLQAQADLGLAHGKDTLSLKTQMSTRRNDTTSPDWRGQVQGFRLEAAAPTGSRPWRLELQKPWSWQARPAMQPSRVQWDAAQWQVQGPSPGLAKLFLEEGFWQASSTASAPQTQAAARWEDVPLTWLPGLPGADMQSDVLLQGQWQMRTQPQLSMTAVIQRSQGDLRIQTDSMPGQQLPAGLRDARLQLNLNGTALDTTLNWDSEHLGAVKAQASTQLSLSSAGVQWVPQAPVQGWIEANLPQVGAWSLLAPPGWRVQGTLASRVELSGTRSQPQWQGRLQADNLAIRSTVQGIEFSQGQLIARLQGQQLILDRLNLRGAGTQGGELQAQGQLGWQANNTAFELTNPMGSAKLVLKIQAKGLRVSNRADRRLAVSGDVTAEMDKGQWRMSGLVQADQALFILPEESTPSLGSDVQVLRTETVSLTKPPHTSAPSWLGTPDVQIRLDLGSDFKVQGQGLQTRLAGQVLLVSNSATRGVPRLTGQVRTEGGRYKAYGQQLDIDTGVLRFNGAYDNPNLDIIALRPNLAQRVGVQVSGTALLPRIRLYADPEMPDADKLAWLVLGRSAASGGAESAVLQQAALVLLSGNGKSLSGELANSLGLDEISLASGSRSDINATGAAVTLGKRLSKDFYMAYESSLSGTFGSLYIFYDLSRRLTLRAQAGQQSALDLIFTVRKD